MSYQEKINVGKSGQLCLCHQLLIPWMFSLVLAFMANLLKFHLHSKTQNLSLNSLYFSINPLVMGSKMKLCTYFVIRKLGFFAKTLEAEAKRFLCMVDFSGFGDHG